MRLSRRMAAGTGAPGDGRFACLQARGGNRSPVSPRADLIAAPLAPPNESPGRCVQRPGPLVPAIGRKITYGRSATGELLSGGNGGGRRTGSVVHGSS